MRKACIPVYVTVPGKITSTSIGSAQKIVEGTKIIKSHYLTTFRDVVEHSTYSRVHRLIHTPKKRTEANYERKLTNEPREEATSIYYDDEVSYSIREARYAHRLMYHAIGENYHNHYIPKSWVEENETKSIFIISNRVQFKLLPLHLYVDPNVNIARMLGLLRETLIGLGFQRIPKHHSASVEITSCPFRSSDKNECGEVTRNIHQVKNSLRKNLSSRNTPKSNTKTRSTVKIILTVH